MDEKLLKQLDMYENDDLEALETILTPSLSGGASNYGQGTIFTDPSGDVDDVLTHIGGVDEVMIRDTIKNRKDKPSQADKPINIVQSNETVVHEIETMSDDGERHVSKIKEAAFPKITEPIKDEINRIATEWIRLDEGIEKLNQTKTELTRQKKLKEAAILNYIETYGLKDITKGRHQLVPKVIKGSRKGVNSKHIKDTLTEFLSNYNFGEEAAQIAEEAALAIEEGREKGDDRVKLEHNRL